MHLGKSTKFFSISMQSSELSLSHLTEAFFTKPNSSKSKMKITFSFFSKLFGSKWSLMNRLKPRSPSGNKAVVATLFISKLSEENSFHGDYSHLPVLQRNESIDLFFASQPIETSIIYSLPPK